MPAGNHLFTVREIALFLQINPLTVYEYIKSRKLPAIKLGRYYRVSYEDLRRFLEKMKV